MTYQTNRYFHSTTGPCGLWQWACLHMGFARLSCPSPLHNIGISSGVKSHFGGRGDSAVILEEDTAKQCDTRVQTRVSRMLR